MKPSDIYHEVIICRECGTAFERMIGERYIVCDVCEEELAEAQEEEERDEL